MVARRFVVVEDRGGEVQFAGQSGSSLLDQGKLHLGPCYVNRIIPFCADNPHNIALARCLDSLDAKGASAATIKKYLTDLTGGRSTHGALCELLVYDWLDQNGTSFEAQVAVTGAEVLSPSGSNLDGKLTVCSEVYFDVKRFGFQEVSVGRLKDRLES